MNTLSDLAMVGLLAGATALGGCAAAVGAGAAAGGYEYHNKQDLDQLNRQYKEGKISKHDYLERKKEIEQGSVVY